MSISNIVWIVVGIVIALILIGLITVIGRKSAAQKRAIDLEYRRAKADRLRAEAAEQDPEGHAEEAETDEREAQAQIAEADAEARAADGQIEEVAAEQRSTRAEQELEDAHQRQREVPEERRDQAERRKYADEIDPDVDVAERITHVDGDSDEESNGPEKLGGGGGSN